MWGEIFAAQLGDLLRYGAVIGFCAGAFVVLVPAALLAVLGAFKKMTS